MVIFLCDDYVRLNVESPEVEAMKHVLRFGLATPESESYKRTLRFFNIAARLNMDLQMVLCNRLYGLTKDVISSKYSEAAFRNVVRRFLTKRREN